MFNFGNNTAPEEDSKTDKSEFQDLKKKRDQYAVEIRKQKREELLYKKRNRNLDIDQKLQDKNLSQVGENAGEDSELKNCIDKWLRHTFDMSEFPQLVEAAASNDRFKQHYGVIGLRKILSNEAGPPIQPVIDANMVPRLIQFTQRANEPHLQLEAAWALTNVASGTTQQTQTIIDKGGIPCFINLLTANRVEVAEQAIWALGNIAGDSPNFRDLILVHGGLRPLIDILSTTEDPQMIKNGTWAISNLCRGRPLPDIKLVEQAIPILCQVLKRETDPDVLTDAAWAVSYLSRGAQKIQAIIETQVIPSLVKHLENSYLVLVIPCLRILGNIITGSELQTNLVLSIPEFLPRVFQLFGNQKKAVRREACWVTSNVTAGNSEQIALVMDKLEYVQLLLKVATTDIPEVQREAIWALSNATKNSSPVQVAKMIEMEVMDCFIHLLDSPDSKTIEVVLEGLFNMLNWGAHAANENNTGENEFLLILENKGGVVKVEQLQKHPSTEVYAKALKILETHFEIDSVI